MKARYLAPIIAAAYLPLGPAQAQEIGDPEQGAIVFKKCATCHKVGPDARNAVGPVLNGIIGRTAGTYPKYRYSKANKESGVTWEVETLTVYLRAPREFIPGTKMPFAGLKKDEDIANLIAYLSQFDAEGNTVME
ncbi:MAG: cytochrome c family protein [Hyphomicrobiales bacterium]|nr:cytochrome c family protein [Hyphomicrobiales bacterium]